MPKVIILPLSFFMDNQQQKSKEEFIKLGVNRFSLLWHFLPFGDSLPKIFDQYRRGEFDCVAFRNKIRAKFPNATITDAAFDHAWNAMLGVTELTKNALAEAKDLISQGIEVCPIAGTNAIHLNDIKQKTGFAELPGTSYLSFEQKKLGRELFTGLLKDIRQKHTAIRKEDIAYFYMEPQDPYPRLGKLAWLYDPIRKFEYYQAQKYVAQLKREAASSNGFTLVEFKCNNEKTTNIKSSIDKLGWLSTKPVNRERVRPAITYNLRSQAKKLDINAAKSLKEKEAPKKVVKNKK